MAIGKLPEILCTLQIVPHLTLTHHGYIMTYHHAQNGANRPNTMVLAWQNVTNLRKDSKQQTIQTGDRQTGTYPTCKTN